MSAEWICDGCGKRAPGIPTELAGWMKPGSWFERNLTVVVEDGVERETKMFEDGRFKGILTACSRECIDRVANETGTHGVVAPW